MIPDVVLAADKLDAEGRIPAPVLLKELGLESSTSNARRVIEQGGFNVGLERRETITDVKALIHVSDGLIVRVGKRKIARVRLGLSRSRATPNHEENEPWLSTVSASSAAA